MGVSYPNLAYWTIAQTRRVVPIAKGNPGMSKSASARAFLARLGYDCYTFEGSLHEPTDLGFPAPQDVTWKDGEGNEWVDRVMAMLIPDFMLDCLMKPNMGILWDEMTCIPEQMQTAMMSAIHDRRIGKRYFPASTIMLAACNPTEIAANGHDFAPPLVTRMCHLPWEMDWEAWEIGMSNGGHYPEPRFEILPNDWEKHIGWVAGRVTAFLRHMPNLRDTTPIADDPEFRVKATKPYANPRSWNNVGICRAACIAVDAEKDVQYQAIRGCVGDEVCQQFAKWEENLDLPDPEEILVKAVRACAKGKDPEINLPVRSDKAMALLGGIVDCALNKGRENGSPSKTRWEAAAAIYNTVCRTGSMEIVVATASPLLSSSPPNATIPPELIEQLYPILKRTGLLGRR